MKVCILSCSPKGENSLTLSSVRFLEKFYPNDEFRVHITASVNCPDEAVKSCADADLVLFAASIFHLNVHAQMMSMLDDLLAKLKTAKNNDLSDTFFTCVTTSNFLYDVGAHAYIKHWADNNHLNYLRILSLKDDSVLEEWGREELFRWFQYTKDTIEYRRSGGIPKVTKPRRVSIINDGLSSERTDRVKELYEERGCEVKVFNIQDKVIKPCVACFACYSNRKCCIEDDFEKLVDDIGTGADIFVTMGNLKCGMLSQQYKFFTDRHVQFGRAGSGDEIIHMTLLETDEDVENRTRSLTEFSQWEEATCGIGREYHVGAFFSRICSEDVDISDYINDSVLVMNNELYGQRNTFSETLNTRFAELAYMLQYMCPVDFEHYRQEGYYNDRPINMNVDYINDIKSGMSMNKMRLVTYKDEMSKINGAPILTERRKYRNMSYVEHRRMGDALSKESKPKLFARFARK